MIIYSEDIKSSLTPAQAYAGIHDMEQLLTLVEKGEIPSGTGQIFPVNFSDNNSENNNIQLSPEINYWAR